MDMKENIFDFDFNPKIKAVDEPPKKDLYQDGILDFDFNFIDIKNFKGLRIKEVEIEEKKPNVAPKATIYNPKKY